MNLCSTKVQRLLLTLLNSSYIPFLLSACRSFWNLTALRFCTLGQSDTHTTSCKVVGENADSVGKRHPITQGLRGSVIQLTVRPSNLQYSAPAPRGPAASSLNGRAHSCPPTAWPVKKPGCVPSCMATLIPVSQHHQCLSPQINSRTSLASQWLRPHASNTGDTGSILGWGTKIPHAAQPKNKHK